MDSARARHSENVADLCRRINFDDAVQIGSGRDRDLLALDGALNTLARRDPRKVRMIELPGPAPRRLVEWEIVDPTEGQLKRSGKHAIRGNGR